jgi:hypothetical protein
MYPIILQGWRSLGNHLFLIVLLSIYNLSFNVWLYKRLQDLLLPYILRYPTMELPAKALHLYLMELQLELWQWLGQSIEFRFIFILLLLRIVLSPIWQAGMYYSIVHADLPSGYRFVTGVKSYSFKFICVHLVQWILFIVPLIGLILGWIKPFIHFNIHAILSIDVAIYWVIFMLYIGAVKTCFMYIQFALITSSCIRHTAWKCICKCTPIAVLVFIFLCLRFGFVEAQSFVTNTFPGWIAMTVFMTSSCVYAMLKIWSVATHHLYWTRIRNH